MTLVKCKDCTFSTIYDDQVQFHINCTNHEIQYLDEDES